MQPKSWWSRSLWIAATYVIAANFLPNLLLVLINSVGYLPYSDRPGPGWQTPHLPSGQELGFFAGLAVLLLPATGIIGMVFAAADACSDIVAFRAGHSVPLQRLSHSWQPD